MERLTFRLKTGEVLMATECEGKYTDDEWIRILQERIAAYEDSRMTPGEIHSMRMDMAIINAMFQDTDVERMKELARADREGRVVVLPCKVGDTVYVNGEKRTVQATIDEAHLDDVNRIEYIVSFACDKNCDGCPFNSWRQDHEGEYSCEGEWEQSSIMGSDFGKTVFLTREEAEEALRRAENG